MKKVNGSLNEAQAVHLGRIERICWPSIIDLLNLIPRGRVLVLSFGSAGSAQVTRCRVLEEYTNVEATTRENLLYLRLTD